MVLKCFCFLEMPFSYFTYQIIGIYLAKISILVHVLLKSAILMFGRVYDVILTWYVECLYLFWYVWKDGTHSYTVLWYSLDVSGVQFLGSQPPVYRVAKKRLKTRGF